MAIHESTWSSGTSRRETWDVLRLLGALEQSATLKVTISAPVPFRKFRRENPARSNAAAASGVRVGWRRPSDRLLRIMAVPPARSAPTPSTCGRAYSIGTEECWEAPARSAVRWRRGEYRHTFFRRA